MVVPTARELRMLFKASAANRAPASSSASLALGTDAVEAAFAKCRAVTSEYSKTFFLGSQLLGRDEQRAVWAIYNWCRVTDELVDGPAAAGTTMSDLDAREAQLERAFHLLPSAPHSADPEADWEDIAIAASASRFALIRRPFQDMLGGMAMDLVKARYETFRELEVYCYRVAGTVGLMTLPVLGLDPRRNVTEEMHERTIAAAMSLGMALQLTNILRDVGEDARRGRIYLPVEDLVRFGISEEELLEASHKAGLLFHEDRWRSFMEFQIGRCEHYYAEAEGGVLGLAAVSRLGVMVALQVYRAILEAVRANDYDNFSKRAFVHLHEKVFLVGKAWWRVQGLLQAEEASRVPSQVVLAHQQAQANFFA